MNMQYLVNGRGNPTPTRSTDMSPAQVLMGLHFNDDTERFELIKLIAEQMPKEPLAQQIADKCREELMP